MAVLNNIPGFMFLVTVYGISVGRADSVDCRAVIWSTDIRTSPLSCDFNTDTCGYMLSGQWKRRQNYGYHLRTNITGHENSSFVVYDKSFSSTSRQSVVSSPELKPGTYCLSVWVASTGFLGQLHIRTSTGNNVTVIRGSFTSNWREHIISFNETSKPFQVEFQNINPSEFSKYGTTAIDDIILVQTSGIGTSGRKEVTCTPSTEKSTNDTCNFNMDSCGYSINGHFERRSGPYSYAGSYIQNGRENSPYIVCNWSETGKSNNNTLISGLLEPGTYCLTFWYYATGSSVGVSVFTSSGLTLFANISDPEATHSWTQTSISFTEHKPFRILFQILRATGFFTSSQTVGLDDIRIASVQQNICSEIVPEGTCTFTNKQTCGFTFDTQRWKPMDGSFELFTRPVIPSGQDDRYYAVFESFQAVNNENNDQQYDITSPLLGPGHYCLSFWFFFPNHFSNLTIVLSNGNQSIALWTMQMTQRNWTEGILHLNQTEDFKIIFRSYHVSKYKGAFVGLDNIRLTKQPENLSTRTTWQTKTIPMPTLTPTSTITASSPTITTSSLTTPTTIIPTTWPTAATATSKGHTCSCQCPSYESTCLRTTSVPAPTPIPRACALPEMSRVRQPLLSCDFNTDTCRYNVPFYPHLWEQSSNRFGNTQMGEIKGDQSIDHSGGYMLFNTYNNHVQNNRSHTIESPRMSANVPYCLSFWYNMPTNHSNLAVYAVYGDQSPRKLLWATKDQLHTPWIHQFLGVLEFKPFHLMFESVKENFFGFLGLDNVQVSIAQITTSTEFTTPKMTPPTPSQTDPHCNCSCPVIDCDATTPLPPVAHPCGDLSLATRLRALSCDFDEGDTACGYMIPMYPHLWEVHRYEYGNASVGYINGDGSKDGDGGYLLFNTNNYHVQPGKKDEVTSPHISTANKTCLSFVYNVPSAEAVLSIYQDKNGQRTLLWNSSNMTTNGWKQEAVLIPSGPQYQVVFSSIKSGLNSYIGLDNIDIFTNLVISEF